MLIKDFINAFQQGKSLANSATWKNRGIATNALAAFFGSAVSIAAFFGYQFNIDSATVQALAGGIAAAVTVANLVLHTVTSDKVGLPAKPYHSNGPANGSNGSTTSPDVPVAGD